MRPGVQAHSAPWATWPGWPGQLLRLSLGHFLKAGATSLRQQRPMAHAALIGSSLLIALAQLACSGRSAPAPGSESGPSAEAAPLSTQPITHGPFEIRPGVRRVSTGTFPNQGGNPFATRGVSEFKVHHRGKPVAMPGGGDTWWRVLRLQGAPRPALLLVTTGFVLATEDEQGRLQLQPLRSESNSLAETQWLDAQGGQPGERHTYGIEAVRDMEAGTQLAGGRWLRLGSRSIVDVATLTVHPVEPWVPMLPGVPIKSLSREGDKVRAFSPGRTAYVLAASGIDYDAPGQPQAYGLLVVTIAKGTAVELRTPRRRFRFGAPDDINPAWIDHHFVWQPDGGGGERLVPRERFAPWPWRAKGRDVGGGRWELDIPRIAPEFIPVLRRLLSAEPGAQLADARFEPNRGFEVQMGGCALSVRAFGTDNQVLEDRRIAIWPPDVGPASGTPPACDAAMRRVAALVDAELATGRHDGLLLLER